MLRIFRICCQCKPKRLTLFLQLQSLTQEHSNSGTPTFQWQRSKRKNFKILIEKIAQAETFQE